jgi:DNA-binding PadR family transcriptional regulator
VEPVTNAELAILSLVAQEPRHGYEIEQVIEQRGMREWTEIGFSSIYYLLKKLEQGGLVEGHLEETKRGPARRVYRPTPAGREALRVGLLDALSVPRRSYPPLQLGLSNLSGIPLEEALEALSEYRNALGARMEQIQARWESQKPLPYFVDAQFDHSVTMVRAEQAWVEQFIRQLERREHTVLRQPIREV